MAITPLSSVTLTSEETQAVLDTLVVPWPLVFEELLPGSAEYLSYRNTRHSDLEDLANWHWTGNPEDRPDDATLLAAFATYAAQFEANQLEAARVDKWRLLVDNEVDSDVQNIPGWFSWTEEQALNWIAANVEPELGTNAPKTLQAIESLTRIVIAMRNKQWPNFEGS